MSFAATPAPDALRPVTSYLPDWTPRRVNENARAGRIPGVVKVGRSWMLRGSDFDRWVAGDKATAANDAPPTIDEATRELRRRGVL